MKRCPKCNLRHDDALSYCRVHGTPLVPDSVASESETAALPAAPPSGDFATQVLERLPSIAVLPFANMSSDPENEYFCDGLAEELSNALAKVEGLKVAARTSAFSFKGLNRGVGEIGHALNVSSVLEGSVRKSGSRLRITVKLVNASDGYHLWSEKYDREMKDIFDVQDEITLAVVGALRVRLLGEEKAAVLKRHTDDAEAYQLYLRGNYHLYKFTPDDLRRAISYFDEAIAKDPNYALAYSGLAGAYSIARDFGDGAAAARWEVSARKAVALDPTLSEARAMLAVHAFWNRRDLAEAHGEFTRALELNPNSAIVCHYYSWFLVATARFDEAQEHLRRALELDPLSPSINVDQGLPLYFSRRYAEARSRYEQALKLDANFAYAHVRLAEACEGAGDAVCAVGELERAASLSNTSIAKAQLARALALAGRREEARSLLEELNARSTPSPSPPYLVALAYSALGATDEAFDSLERAAAENDKWLGWVKVDPRLDPLRSDPRFAELVRKVGLAQ